MNNRERINDILHFRPVDRMPAVHFGYWAELLVEWAEQGHIPKDLAEGVWDGNDKDRELDSIIGWDCDWDTLTGPVCVTTGVSDGEYPKCFLYARLN